MAARALPPFDRPHAYPTGETRPGAVGLVVLLPPAVYVRYVREAVLPLELRKAFEEGPELREAYETRPGLREEHERRQENHLSRMEEHNALAATARVVGTVRPPAPDQLEACLIEECGLAEVHYVVERYPTAPFVVMGAIPRRISELYAARQIVPHRFTWEVPD